MKEETNAVAIASGRESALTTTEQERLEFLEERIEAGIKTFIQVGNDLLEIREKRLYRIEYGTFEDYCERRWGWSWQRAYQLMGAAEVVGNIETSTMVEVLPTNERQVRPLTKLPAAEQGAAWQKAVAEANGKPVTAAIVEKAVERRAPAAEPVPVTVEPAAGCESPSVRPLSPDQRFMANATCNTLLNGLKKRETLEIIRQVIAERPDFLEELGLKQLPPAAEPEPGVARAEEQEKLASLGSQLDNLDDDMFGALILLMIRSRPAVAEGFGVYMMKKEAARFDERREQVIGLAQVRYYDKLLQALRDLADTWKARPGKKNTDPWWMSRVPTYFFGDCCQYVDEIDEGPPKE
jgi:hypothetical protein